MRFSLFLFKLTQLEIELDKDEELMNPLSFIHSRNKTEN